MLGKKIEYKKLIDYTMNRLYVEVAEMTREVFAVDWLEEIQTSTLMNEEGKKVISIKGKLYTKNELLHLIREEVGVLESVKFVERKNSNLLLLSFESGNTLSIWFKGTKTHELITNYIKALPDENQAVIA